MSPSRIHALCWVVASLLCVPAIAQDPAKEPAPGNAAPSQNAKKGDWSPMDDYTARHTFEVHSAMFLKKMLMDEITLTPEEQAKVDREFADYIRRTMEQKPRPVFIAYSTESSISYGGEELEAGGETAAELYDEIKEKGAIQRPRFADLVQNDLDASQIYRYQIVINRWKELRPAPLDGPFRRLNRALRDPQLTVDDKARAALSEEVKQVFKDVPKPERRPGFTDKYEPEARRRVLAKLDARQGEHLKKTLALLEADYIEWQQPGHVKEVYKDALRILGESEPKPAPAEDAAAPAQKKPD